MKKNMTVLDETELKLLETKFEVLTFPQDFDLVYEKQVPNTGIALLSGEIALTRKKLPSEKLAPGHMLGIYHLLHQKPVKLGCRVRKNSKLVLLPKAAIEEALQNPESQLHSLVQKLSAANE